MILKLVLRGLHPRSGQATTGAKCAAAPPSAQDWCGRCLTHRLGFCGVAGVTVTDPRRRRPRPAVVQHPPVEDGHPDRVKPTQRSTGPPERDRTPMTAETLDAPTTHRACSPGSRGRRADPARPDRLVRRLGRGVDPADRRAGRGRHPRPAGRGEEAELVLGAHRPDRRRPGRGAHLHLLGRRGRRRADQQLDGPGRDEGDHDRAVPRLACAAGRCTSSRSAWARSTAEKPMFGVEITDSRVRRRLDADHDPDGRRRPRADGRRRRRSCRPALGRRAARARPARRAVAVQRRPSTSRSSPRSG